VVVVVDYLDENGELTAEGEKAFALSCMQAYRLDKLNTVPVTEEDHWIIPGIVSTSNTYVYGQAKVGKSFLVSSIVASVVSGNELLGKTPLQSGLNCLVLTSDSGSDKEYQERISRHDIDEDRIYVRHVGNTVTDADWADLYAGAEAAEVGLVVLDHASGVLEGDINLHEPWRDLWNRLEKFPCARVLVGHSTDSKFEGREIKRPSGNSAASQFPRAKVYLSAPGGAQSTKRVLSLTSNNAPAETLECDLNSDGLFRLRGEPGGQSQNRSDRKKELGSLLVEVALEHPPAKQEEVHKNVANDPRIIECNGGEAPAPGTVRNKLRSNKGVEWDRKAKRYFLQGGGKTAL